MRPQLLITMALLLVCAVPAQASSFRDSLGFSEAMSVSKEIPKPTVETESITKQGPTWTWPGDLNTHLETVHSVDTSGFTFEQSRQMHDDLHNGLVSLYDVGVESCTDGSCPDGSCPSGSSCADGSCGSSTGSATSCGERRFFKRQLARRLLRRILRR